MASGRESRESREARMSQLWVRVADVERAAAFFGALFEWQFRRTSRGGWGEQRLVPGRVAIDEPIGVVFHDERGAPPVRLELAVSDVPSAVERAHRLGGSGPAEALVDDQGVPLALAPPSDATAAEPPVYSSGVGVVILDVPDTARARTFHAGLFGRSYHSIGHGDRWWVNGMRLGIFAAPAIGVRFWCVVGSLDATLARVRELGGSTSERAAMGPYSVCDCHDDQGTAFGLWHDPAPLASSTASHVR